MTYYDHDLNSKLDINVTLHALQFRHSVKKSYPCYLKKRKPYYQWHLVSQGNDQCKYAVIAD